MPSISFRDLMECVAPLSGVYSNPRYGRGRPLTLHNIDNSYKVWNDLKSFHEVDPLVVVYRVQRLRKEKETEILRRTRESPVFGSEPLPAKAGQLYEVSVRATNRGNGVLRSGVDILNTLCPSASLTRMASDWDKNRDKISYGTLA